MTFKHTAPQRAAITAVIAAHQLRKIEKPTARPTVSWWLDPETFYATAKVEAIRMTAIRTNYHQPDPGRETPDQRE